NLTGVSRGAAAWGDYNNDGLLDIIVTGDTGSQRIAEVYKNVGSSDFTVIATLTGVHYSSVAWGDYDNDGDLDVLMTGQDNNTNPVTRLYQNQGGDTFSEKAVALDDVWQSSVAWGDYDNDGDLDILLTGRTATNTRLAKIYQNNGIGTFTEDINASSTLEGVSSGAVAWGDYDNDDDLDILLTGTNGSVRRTNIYENDGNKNFTEIGNIVGFADNSVAWGDYDNDGDLDILLAGQFGVGNGNYRSMIYRNNGGSFVEDFNAGNFDSVVNSSVDWGDYDNDGDLDILLSGMTEAPSSTSIAKIYANDPANTLPAAPTGLSALSIANVVTLTWVAASDFETPSQSLSYNLWLRDQSSLTYTVSPHADTSTGYRRIPALGNVQLTTTRIITGLAPGIYDWQVQAVDHSWAGSPFAIGTVITVSGLETIASWVSTDGGLAEGLALGDVDGDGDLDMAVANSSGSTKVYFNQNGVFDTIAGWTSSDTSGSRNVAWGDMDGDGDLDLAVASGVNTVYLNQNGMLQATAVWSSTDSVATESVAWGDIDGDGDLDLAVGNTGGAANNVYLNQNGLLQTTPVWTSATADGTGSVAWGDMDGDGDLDLATANWPFNNKIYLNQGGMLQTTPVWTSTESEGTIGLAWGDLNGDGHLDLAVGNQGPSRVYLNQGTILNTTANWTSNDSLGSYVVAWGDMDNDGDLDLAASSNTGPNKVYLNQGGTLLPDAVYSSENSDGGRGLAWGDINGDGALDLALANLGGTNKVYLNHPHSPNILPTAPTGLAALVSSDTVTLTWNAATDTETPSLGLNYNVWLRKSDSLTYTVSPHACINYSGCGGDGYRQSPALGNAQMTTTRVVTGLTPGTYVWNVQAVDTAWAGSAFAPVVEVVSSTFDTDADGWTSVGTASFNHLLTGGNPGGRITGTDGGGGLGPGNFWFYYSAPLKFLGDQRRAYQGRLSFDRNRSDDEYVGLNSYNIILVGNAITLTISTTTVSDIAPSWSAESVPLVEGTGWMRNGVEVTRQDMHDVLKNLTGLFILGDLGNATDSSSLDNVRLLAPGVVNRDNASLGGHGFTIPGGAPVQAQPADPASLTQQLYLPLTGHHSVGNVIKPQPTTQLLYMPLVIRSTVSITSPPIPSMQYFYLPLVARSVPVVQATATPPPPPTPEPQRMYLYLPLLARPQRVEAQPVSQVALVEPTRQPEPTPQAVAANPATLTCDRIALARHENHFQMLAMQRAAGQTTVSDAQYQSVAETYVALAGVCFTAMADQDVLAEPQYIDDGGIWYPGSGPIDSPDLTLSRTPTFTYVSQWNKNVVTYSFIPNGVNNDVEGEFPGIIDLTNKSLLSLEEPPAFDASGCLDKEDPIRREIEMAFAAWSAVANITFVEVVEAPGRDLPSNYDEDAFPDAAGDIRLGAHEFLSSSRLAHAYFPPPNGRSIAGDIHFNTFTKTKNSEEESVPDGRKWSCDGANDTFDIGLVAMHEIGHAIGLDHQPFVLDNQPGVLTLALMNAEYNSTIAAPLPDDRAGAVHLYGEPRNLWDEVGCANPRFVDLVNNADESMAMWTQEKKVGDNEWQVINDPTRRGQVWSIRNVPGLSDTTLQTPVFETTKNSYSLQFWHHYNTQQDFGGFYDGGVIEIEVNGGEWRDVGRENIFRRGYTSRLFTDLLNPLADRWAFTGYVAQTTIEEDGTRWQEPTYVKTMVDLHNLLKVGDTFRLRFRFATDFAQLPATSNENAGWYLDDIRICETNLTYYTQIYR
ncbi:MAG: FG-GAP-like repeat-containing protein, partial [Chloroflexota bacterium]